ncbi:MAG: sugar phosphate isomerase/epimerase family protein [Planctomycetota bacterium]
MFTLSSRCFSSRGSIAELCTTASDLGFRSIMISNHDVAPRPGNVSEAILKLGVKIDAAFAGCLEGRTGVRRASEELASLDEGRRTRAVRSIQDHAAFAKALQCQVIVISGGAAEGVGVDERVRHIEGLADRGAPTGELIEEVKLLVSRNREKHLESLCRSLHAATRGNPDMKFAILPASRPGELLDSSAVDDVFSDVKSTNLFVWFDAGASRAGELTGCEPTVTILEKCARRIIGIQLHDSRGMRQHFIPGEGTVDWKLIKEHTPRFALRVVDLDVGAGAHAVHESVRVLTALGFD